MADTRAHASHLPVAPFAQGDRQAGELMPAPAHRAATPYLGGRRARSVEEDTATQLVEIVLAR
jgi:hypothetical protein